jgi:hypothetical protein
MGSRNIRDLTGRDLVGPWTLEQSGNGPISRNRTGPPPTPSHMHTPSVVEDFVWTRRMDFNELNMEYSHSWFLIYIGIYVDVRSLTCGQG